MLIEYSKKLLTIAPGWIPGVAHMEGLHYLVRSLAIGIGLGPQLLIVFFVGVLFHAAIIARKMFDFEHIMYHFIAGSVLAYCGGIVGLMTMSDYSVGDATIKTTLFAAAFNTGILSSMVVYRLFFHRCRSFPGPVMARISRFYTTYPFQKHWKYYQELEKLHAKYGYFVRTGPREISIMDKNAIPLIYGPKSECRKSIWYEQSGGNPDKISINMLRDKEIHRRRRRAWDRGLSIKSIMTYQPRVKGKVDVLLKELDKRVGEPLNVTDWANFFGFDLMGDIGFGKEFRSMETGEEHPAIQAIHDHHKILGIMGTLPWLLNLLSSLPGAAAPFGGFFAICREQMALKSKELDDGKDREPQDIASWLLKAIKEKDPSASPTPESLDDDSRVLIIAGSDTTSDTLASVLYYLSKHPTIQFKLHNQLLSAIPGGYSTSTYEAAKSVAYLDSIINEALRLKPPVVRIPARVTPPQGLHVGTTYIPGNVHVAVPTVLTQRDPRWWKDANDFVPERWVEWREEWGTDGAPFMPFNLGMHACPGMNLGYLSLRTSISAIVMSFEVEFAEGEDGRVFDEEWEDTMLITLKPLYLKFKRRE